MEKQGTCPSMPAVFITEDQHPRCVCGGGDRVLQTLKSQEVKQLFVNASVVLKDPGKSRQQLQGQKSQTAVVHLDSYAGDHGPRNPLRCLLQNVGTEERAPASTCVTSSPGFLPVCPLMWHNYWIRVPAQHRRTNCLRSVKELRSAHPFKLYF